MAVPAIVTVTVLLAQLEALKIHLLKMTYLGDHLILCENSFFMTIQVLRRIGHMHVTTVLS